MMGYRTVNDESHMCTYCDIPVDAGQGVLVKYALSQSDEAIVNAHLTDRVAHEKCIKRYGSKREQDALIPFKQYNKRRY